MAISPNHHGLITRERAEKFDLLGQLILNQREAIILCGFEGIGKTTLLTAFKKTREDIWAICLLQGLETLNFKQIQTQLILTIQQRHPELANHDLQSSLISFEQKQQKIVLMIDDAAKLAAGLITTLTEYAIHNCALRIVFAFTREQLYLKNSTDRVLDDCYFMEMPALTKMQMVGFLQDLSIFTHVEKTNDELLAKLYRQTRGIPGKIITDFPLLAELARKKAFSPLKSLLLLSGFSLSAAFFYFYNDSHKHNFSNSRHISDFELSASAAPVIKHDVIAIKKHDNLTHKSVDTHKLVAITPAPEIPLNNKTLPSDPDQQWALQQIAEHYTLQLMASPKREALLAIAKEGRNLPLALKVFHIKAENQEKYVLLYGSFANTKAASSAAATLPAAFKRAWPRQFKTLQKDIKNSAVPLLKQPLSKQ